MASFHDLEDLKQSQIESITEFIKWTIESNLFFDKNSCSQTQLWWFHRLLLLIDVHSIPRLFALSQRRSPLPSEQKWSPNRNLNSIPIHPLFHSLCPLPLFWIVLLPKSNFCRSVVMIKCCEKFKIVVPSCTVIISRNLAKNSQNLTCFFILSSCRWSKSCDTKLLQEIVPLMNLASFSMWDERNHAAFTMRQKVVLIASDCQNIWKKKTRFQTLKTFESSY